jgi:hypothetical protein
MRTVEAIRRRAGNRLALASSIVAIAFAQTVFAQTPGPAAPPPGVTPVTPAAPASASGGGWLFLGLLVGLFVIVGIAVKVYDLSRKRSDEAVRVQARIADALLLDPALVNLPVAATVHASLRRGSPMLVDVSGRVPSREIHDTVMNLVAREARSAGVEFHLEDDLVIDAAAAARHAA